MSSSDGEKQAFKPIDIKTLDSFEAEQANKDDKAAPDFNRFKMLFEKSAFEDEEPYSFEAIYDPEKEQEEIIFKPLIERPGVKADKDSSQENNPSAQPSDAEAEPLPELPEETIEEIAYREGFERGMADGMQEGEKKGFDQGKKKGEQEGFEKGHEEGFAKGEQEGFESGEKAGEEKGENETREKGSEILNSLEQTLSSADQTLELLVDRYEDRIISLVQQIAQKAVLAKIETDETVVRQMIIEALKTLVEPEEVVLNICPEDYEYIEMIKEEFFEQVESLNRISVRSDPSVLRGGCRIETRTGTVSTDPQSRLDAIFEAMKEAGKE
jgi:flagellar assembly protein FliH